MYTCDPMDYSPPGFSVYGISQARLLEWVATPFSRGSSWPRNQVCVSCMQADSLLSEPPGRCMCIYIYSNAITSDVFSISCKINESVQFSRSVMSDSLQPHGLQHTSLPYPSPTSGACSKSCPSSQSHPPSTNFILCHPLLLLP